MRHKPILPEFLHETLPRVAHVGALLWRRFARERLSQTAASLTFATLVSLVPLLALAFSVFTAFPAFRHLQTYLQDDVSHALLPPEIATTVLRHLDGFAAKAKSLGALGVGGLVFVSTTMMLTVDRALNAIWRTARPRPLAQRVLVYWAAITLAPLTLAAGLAASAALVATHRGWLHQWHGADSVVLTLLAWALMAGGLGALYRYVPNTEVKWRDALAGGLFAAIGFDLAGRAFAWYIASVPTFTVIYGAFATLPIFLLWINWSWTVVLLGAMLAAVLPLVRLRVRPHAAEAGSDLLLALQIARQLDHARQAPRPGRSGLELARALHRDPLALQSPLHALEALGWIGHVAPAGRDPRWALLVDPASTALAPLLDRLLLDAREARGVAPGLAAAIAEGAGGLTIRQGLDVASLTDDTPPAAP